MQEWQEETGEGGDIKKQNRYLREPFNFIVTLL